MTPELSQFARGTAAARWLAAPRTPNPRGAALFPKVVAPREDDDYLWSLDRDMLLAAERLGDRLTAEFPENTRKDGLAAQPFVPGAFHNVRNVSGWGMDPLSIPLHSNTRFREAQGLAGAIRPQDRPWLLELIRLFFHEHTPASAYIRKAASTGFPFFATDIMYKKLATMRLLDNLPRVMALASRARWRRDPAALRALLALFEVVLVYAVNERQQPNAISKTEGGTYTSKPRTAPSPEEARTGRYSGNRFADMTVWLDGGVVDGHFAMRRRDVFGMNGPANYLLSCFMSQHREVYLREFAFTFKTRGAQDKVDRASKFGNVGSSDVKTMDKNIPWFFFSEVLEGLGAYWPPGMVDLLWLMLRAPYVVPHPYRAMPLGYNPLFGGSPLDPASFTSEMGLPSGISANPDLGKLFMTFVYAVVYRDAGLLQRPEQLSSWLRGQLDVALMDMSDDAAFLTTTPEQMDRIFATPSPYVQLDRKKPSVFLGDLFAWRDGIQAYPNPLTYIGNIVSRERSIRRDDVRLYSVGYRAREQVYGRHPEFRDLHRIFVDTMRETTGVDPDYVPGRHVAGGLLWSDTDAIVRENPDAIYYKVDPADVSPDLLDELVATIPAEDVSRRVHPFLTSHLVT